MLYRCVSADPPWLERGGGRITRGAQTHYPLMDKDRIVEVMADWLGLHWWSGFPRDDCRIDTQMGCHMWLWSTDNFLLDGLDVMSRLGFRYIRTLQWIKIRELDEPVGDWEGTLGEVCQLQLQIGLGQYLRGAHEMALLGVRGQSMVPDTKDRMPSVVFAERKQHSAKPDAAIEVIERVSPGPRLEMFARRPRPGWDVVGNEV